MKLNLGCGRKKVQGYLGVDKVPCEATDIIHDLNCFPYPFDDNSIEEILMSHILEHLPNTIAVMEEIWRICMHSAKIRIFVPYYNSPGASQDPTHVRYFTERTFNYFEIEKSCPLVGLNYYSNARFKVISIIPEQNKIFEILPTRIQWFLAHHFSTVHNLNIELKAIKRNK